METCSIFINKTGVKKRTDSVATTGKRGVDNSMRLARVVNSWHLTEAKTGLE